MSAIFISHPSRASAIANDKKTALMGFGQDQAIGDTANQISD
ncbi:MAG: hypothetical protein WB611_27390 [Stellaceae bacterium]